MSSAPRSTMRRHLLWKEFTQYLPIWMAFAGFLAIAIGFSQWLDATEDRDRLSAAMAVIVVGLLPIALGVFMFAPERENQTDQLLASFPVSSRFVGDTKFVVAVFSLFIFIAFALAVLWLVTSDLYATIAGPGTLDQRESLLLYGVLPFSLLVCCSYASLRARNSLTAALGGAGLFVILVWISYLISFLVFPDLNTYASSLVTGGVLAAFTVATYFAMTHRSALWLRNGEGVVQGKRWLRLSGWAEKHSAASQTEKADSLLLVDDDPRHVYRALFWQSFRSHIPLMVLTTVAILAFAASVLNGYQIPQSILHSRLTIMIMIVSGLFGALTFYYDHRQYRFRFFQQNAEFPHKFWLTRVVPGLLMTLLVALIGWGVAQTYLANVDSNATVNWMLQRMTFFNTLLFALTIFSANHLASLYLRSGVFLTLATWAITIVTTCFLLYLFWLDGNLYQFAWAIPVTVLAAGWARSKPWMAESPSKIQWLGPLMMVGIITLLVSAAVVLVRTEFGNYSLKQLIAEQQKLWQPASFVEGKNQQWQQDPRRAKATAAIEQADMAYVGWGNVPDLPADRSDLGAVLTAIVGANERALEHLGSLVKHDDCFPFFAPTPQEDQRQSDQLVYLARVNALFLENEGRLEEALNAHFLARKVWDFTNTDIENRYGLAADLIRWSKHPNQTSDLLNEAIQQHRKLFPWLGRINGKVANFKSRKFIAWFEKWRDGKTSNDEFLNSGGGLAKYLPWEVARSANLTLNEIYWRINRQNYATSQGRQGLRSVVDAWHRQPQYSTENELLRTSCFADQATVSSSEVFDICRAEIQIHRFAHLRLAIEAWRLDHDGQLPSRLGHLVPDYLIELPADVSTGLDFCYLPSGLSKSAVWGSNANLFDNKLVADESEVEFHIKEKTPFLLPWSSSPQYVRLFDDVEGRAKPIEGFRLNGFGAFSRVKDWGGSFELSSADKAD